jgi:hypothetical protein
MINKVKLVQLHEDLFLSGSNLGKRLIEHSGKGHLDLTHDTETDHVIVGYKNEKAHIKNWAFFNEDTGPLTEPKNITKPMVANVAVKAQIGGPNEVFTAQVSTPMDKVQGKPGSKAKYQGEEVQGE